MPNNRHVEQAEAELYASTLIDALMADGGLDAVLRVRSELDVILLYNRSHVDLTNALADPGYTPEQRVRLVKEVFADCHPSLVSVLGVAVERGDFENLPRVKSAFERLITEKLNVTVVDITTRVALDDHLREVIKNKAAADFGTDVVLNETIDTRLLGGIIMNANGKRIDASVNTLLDVARSALKETTDGGEC